MYMAHNTIALTVVAIMFISIICTSITRYLLFVMITIWQVMIILQLVHNRAKHAHDNRSVAR